MIDKLMAIACSLLILGQAFLVRRWVGTWLFPSCLFGLFWFFMSFAPLVVMWWVPVDPSGTAFILLCLFFFSASAMFFPWRAAFRKAVLAERDAPLYAGKFLRISFYVLACATVGCVILSSLAQGVTLTDLVINVFATAAAYRDMLLSGHLTVTIWLRLGQILVFSTAILGGLIVPTVASRRGRFGIMAAAFLPSILMALIQSGKGALFMCIALFYAGILVDRIYRANFHLLKKGSLKKLVIYVVVLLSITTASFMSRGLQDTHDNDFIKQNLELSFASYAFGHLYAFSDWCAFQIGHHSADRYSHAGLSYGFYTFAPIARALGNSKVVPLGIYDEYYKYEDILETNIYTVFRGLVQDFGFVGSLGFMFLLGFVFHAAFYTLLIERASVLATAVFVFSIGFMYCSYIISPFTWSELYSTFVLICMLLWWNRNGYFLLALLRSGIQDSYTADGGVAR